MPQSRTQFAILTACLLAGATGAYAQTPVVSFTPGNLVVDRIGDGSAALTSAATAVFLDEYTTAGAMVQKFALPETVAATGATPPATGPYSVAETGTGTSDGQMSLSPNGQYLAVTGYNTVLGTASVNTTLPDITTGANLRVAAIVNVATGAVNTSTATATPTSGYYLNTTGTPPTPIGNNIRNAAVTDDGASVYTSGATTTGQTGIAYTAASTVGNSVGISSTALNTRVVEIANNSLYFSTGSGGGTGKTGIGIYRVPGDTGGTGLATTPQTPVQIAASPGLTGIAAGQTGSPYDLLFTDANTLYVADDRSAATGGGLEKFTSSDGFLTLANTTLQYTINVGVGLRSVTFDGTNFYATTTETSANKIVTFTDLGTGTAVPTTIATAATNEVFRGIRRLPAPAVVAPEPSSFVVFVIGFGVLGGIIARRKSRTQEGA